jgi:hypothetical protein
MSSPVQAHSKAIFRDATAGALIDAPTRMYLVDAGAGAVTLSAVGPEAYVFADATGTGVYTLMAIADFDPDTMDRLESVQLGTLVRLY